MPTDVSTFAPLVARLLYESSAPLAFSFNANMTRYDIVITPGLAIRSLQDLTDDADTVLKIRYDESVVAIINGRRAAYPFDLREGHFSAGYIAEKLHLPIVGAEDVAGLLNAVVACYRREQAEGVL